jgi:predicted acetyltransferase
MDGKELAGNLVWYPFIQYQEDIEVTVTGIANVMVAPEKRRAGIAGFMMETSLQAFEEDGVPASVLYPFDHRFYRHLGWGYGGELHHYYLRLEQLSDYIDVLEENELSIEMLSDSKLPRMMEFYEAQAHRMNGMLQRNEQYWSEKLIAPPRHTVLSYENGELTGYLIYTLEGVRRDNFLLQDIVVHEWLVTNIDARDTLLSFLARQKDQVRGIKIALPPDEPLHLWLDDPRQPDSGLINRLYAPTATIALGWMYRLVDPKAAFESGRRFNGIKGELNLEIEDDILGDRKLTVAFSGDGARAEGTKASARRAIRAEVDMISQLFCGYMTAQQAYEHALIEFEGSDTVDFCEHAFHLPAPRCYDLF